MSKSEKYQRPYIIAGPCSAETREQTLQTVRALAATGKMDMVRAGVWKPRTRPGSYEGSGVDGLKWLSEASSETGLPFSVEVASPEHIEKAADAGASAVWLGGRTTVSPFAVQQIADMLSGYRHLKVLVKNPINPDIDLWTGAVERILSAGIDGNNILLVHRGFSQYGHDDYRNPPLWHIALDMMERFPDMAMLCDPSHICGNRINLAKVAQTAADLRFDGLMVESHIEPDNALSDAGQQLTPAAFSMLLESINWRDEKKDDPRLTEILEHHRAEIDSLDTQIFALLARRMSVSEEIGRVKLSNDIAIFQRERWQHIVSKALSDGKKLGLSTDVITRILEAIHLESIRRQNEVMNG